ncbi:hypothetical protein [Sphaerothrix gracilis]|uniref:hypothetical protein n=1 Tax=Sphaerothrix gracilis TaxID=3151835 RepID=UPI0031FBD274
MAFVNRQQQTTVKQIDDNATANMQQPTSAIDFTPEELQLLSRAVNLLSIHFGNEKDDDSHQKTYELWIKLHDASKLPPLTDVEWRNKNLATLPSWHPHFRMVAKEADQLLCMFTLLMSRYTRMLTAMSSEPLEQLKNHIDYEVVDYMGERMQAIVDEVWGYRETEEKSSKGRG